ncbi:MAG: hypothetical protein LBF19_01620, partial [Prevotellaceae bacterium]|nr:hypothetical protein [Prevotellaceae bacterium]
WTAATITAATVTAGDGEVIQSSLTGRGFFLNGHNAALPFNATVTVTLAAPLNTQFNACVYASDWPPNATLQSGGGYTLKGTPPFIINGAIIEPSHTFGAGVCITSITDSTGCPGFVVNPPIVTGSILTTGDTVCVGGVPKPITGIMPFSGGDGQLAYSWYKDGILIPDETGADYTPPDTLMPGVYTYTRKVNDRTCNITPLASDGSWVLTVGDYPTISATEPTDQSVCPGTPVTLSVPAQAGVTYTWYNVGGSSLTAGNNYTTGTSGSYYAVATNSSGCTATSRTATIHSSINDITALVVDAPPHCTNQYACTLTFSGWTATPGWEVEYGHGSTIGSNILGSTMAESITCMSPSTLNSYTDPLDYFWARTKNNTCNTTGTARTASYISCICAPISYNCCQTCGVIAQSSYYYGTLGGVCGCTQTNGSMNNITGCIVETITANGTSWQHCHHTNYGPAYWNKQGNICW